MTKLTSQKLVVLPVSEALAELKAKEKETGAKFMLLGHGTTVDPSDILAMGLGMKLPSIDITTLPLSDGERAIKHIMSWKHRRIKMPWVVLIAAEAPTAKSDLQNSSQLRHWYRGLVQPASPRLEVEGFPYVIPCEWVFGAVNTATGNTLMNPKFTGRQVRVSDMKTSEGLRYQTALAGQILALSVGKKELTMQPVMESSLKSYRTKTW